jgi:class I fructose-bisphosphate aldolase
MSATSLTAIADLCGDHAADLLGHRCLTIPKDRLHLPGPDFMDAVWQPSDRTPQVLRSMQALFDHGRLRGTGYVSILPFDQAVEHGAGNVFAANPLYFDPETAARLALEGGCNAIASTFGALGAVARKYAHRIPLILKVNHNEQLTHPRTFDHVMFARVRDAWNMGCAGVSATVFWGSNESARQLSEVAQAFSAAHEFGLFTVLHCYLWNDALTVDGVNHHFSADLTGQANHLGATLQADFVKQKQPRHNCGYKAVKIAGQPAYGKPDDRIYTQLTSDHPIDLARYQVANCYMGRVGLINSGGESGENDLRDGVRLAVINKRAGGMGLICGRKAFQRPFDEGVRLLNAIQDVYLCAEVTVA